MSLESGLPYAGSANKPEHASHKVGRSTLQTRVESVSFQRLKLRKIGRSTLQTRVESASFQRLILNYEAIVFNVLCFAFNFNVRSYSKDYVYPNDNGRAVQVARFKIRVESAPGFSAWNYNLMKSFQTLHSNSTCAATQRSAD
jgi:hypothetical protein